MISKEVLMESLRQRETELHALQDKVERLLDAVLWDAFSEEDETLEIDRAVAEEIREAWLGYNSRPKEMIE